MSKKSSHKINSESDCPCQSGLLFSHCCQRFLDSSSGLYPETAEQLMRSRYSAYVLDDLDYILKTWHPDHQPDRLVPNDSGDHWIGLKIKSTQLGQKKDSTGKVHFIARYKINGKAHKLEENSLFARINGHWLYIKEDIK
ncbi:MAG: hypothetical protein GQ546_08335 [Gammaproteobacteria bacterium]|nr:hypothetical protein [Gammaproteobacteria bacterium]